MIQRLSRPGSKSTISESNRQAHLLNFFNYLFFQIAIFKTFVQLLRKKQAIQNCREFKAT